MRVNLADDPRVVRMSIDLGIPELHVVGALYSLWAWADSHSENGNALSVTKVWLDRYTSVTGFCDALEKVGWIAGDDMAIALPNFCEHNGKSAKTRAQTANRVASLRNGNANTVTTVTPTPLPEKRRIEKRKKENKKQEPGNISLGYQDLPENIATYAEKIDSLLESWVGSPREWRENNALQQSIFGRLGSLEDMQPDDWRTLRWFYLQAEKDPEIKVTHRRLSLVDDINSHLSRAKSAWTASGKPSLAKINKAKA